MRSIAPPLVQTCRVTRLISWTRLWLAWALAVLGSFAGIIPEEFGSGMQRHVHHRGFMLGQLIFILAFARLDRRLIAGVKQKGPAGSRRAAVARASISRSLRRALRCKGLRAQCEALVGVARNIEAHIAKLARRLGRGLTRLSVFAFAPEFVIDALTAACAEPAGADTS